MRHAAALLPILPLLVYATGARGVSPWLGVGLWVTMWLLATVGRGDVTEGYDSTEAFLGTVE